MVPAIGGDRIAAVPAIHHHTRLGDRQHAHRAATLARQVRANAQHGGHARLLVGGQQRLAGLQRGAGFVIGTALALGGRQGHALAVAVGPQQHRGAGQPVPVSLLPGLAATGPAGHAVHAGRSGIQQRLQRHPLLLALHQHHRASGRRGATRKVQRARFVPLLPRPARRTIPGRLAPGIGQRVLAAVAGAKTHHVAVELAIDAVLRRQVNVLRQTVLVLEGRGRRVVRHRHHRCPLVLGGRLWCGWRRRRPGRPGLSR
jgi:hypothetical protein